MNKYWVGGTGNWTDNTNHWSDSSGGSPGATLPTSSDNVYFDANSGTGTCTINATANCADMVWTNSTLLTLAGSSALNVYGSLTLRSGMTVSYTGTWTMRGTSSHTLTSAGVLSGKMIYIGANGTNPTYTLQDNLTCLTVSHVSGTIDTNNTTIIAGWRSSGTSSNTRTLTLGSSTITGSSFSYYSVTNFTLNAGTSTITVNQNNPFYGGGKTYNNVVLAGSNAWAGISDSNTFANLTINGTSGVEEWYCDIGADQTITGTFTVNGASSTNRVFIKSTTVGTQKTITAANVSISNCDFRDIVGAGAGTWSGTSIGNALGNSGITFATPVTRYWVATSGGNWSATTSWSGSSGGSSGASVPLCHDTVVFDSNSISSAGRTITADTSRLGTDIDFSNVTNSPNFALSNPIYIQGGLNLTGINTFYANDVYFTGRSNANLTTNGKTFTNVYFNTVGATVTLLDDFSLTGSLYLLDGTFDANDNDITASSCFGNSGRAHTVYMGSGVWTLTGSGTIWNSYTNFTVYCETSTIKITNTSASVKYFNGNGDTFYKIWITGTGTGTYQFYGGNTYNEFLDDNASNHTIIFPNTTSYFTTFNVSGSSTNTITLSRTGSSGTFTLSKSSGVVGCNYLSISNSTATGGATWYAGANSTDGGGNTGWLFSSQPGNLVQSVIST